jgi:transcriptional regulator with XRE-family HTH domain
MTIHQATYPTVEFLIGKFADWLKHRRELSEVRQLDRTQFDQIASDLRISSGDLDQLVQRGPHSADQLPQMLKSLGISEAGLKRAQPFILRDMQRVCSLCHDKAHCDRELAAGTAAEHYSGYCPNASNIDASTH